MKFLCFDLGIFVEQANALWKSKDDTVWYWTNWASAFPKFQDYAIGKDFEHLTKILYLGDYIDKADCIVAFDCHYNDIINFLKKIYPHKSIYGAGLGERLENDRWGLKKIIKELNLPLQKAVKIKGLNSLRDYLKNNPDKYIKLSIFRGDFESFYAKDYNSVELILNEMESSFGPFKEDYEFIVEDNVKSNVEIGYDGFFNGVDYLKPYFVGYEYHKGLYLANVTEELPLQLKETMDKFKSVLQRLDWRGAISTEEKIISKIEHYFLDICARLPAPLSALYPQFIDNWQELIYKIGKRQSVRLDVKYKYLGAIPLESEHARNNWLKIDIDKGHRDNIKFRMVCSSNGKYIANKGMDSVVVLVAGGNTIDEVLNKLKESAKYVDAYGLDKDSVNGIDVIKSIIEKGKKVGIDF